jgi:hypothetical protein
MGREYCGGKNRHDNFAARGADWLSFPAARVFGRGVFSIKLQAILAPNKAGRNLHRVGNPLHHESWMLHDPWQHFDVC